MAECNGDRQKWGRCKIGLCSTVLTPERDYMYLE